MLHTNYLYNTIARRMNKFTVQFVRRAQFAEAKAPTNVCRFQKCQRGRDRSGARIWEATLFGDIFRISQESPRSYSRSEQ